MNAIGTAAAGPRLHGQGPAGQERDEPPPGRWAPVLALGVWAVLIAGALVWGRWLMAQGYRMKVAAPPLTGHYDPLFTPLAAPALALAAVAVARGRDLARRLPWRRMLVAAGIAAAAWAMALAVMEGVRGIPDPARSPLEYLPDVALVGSPVEFLRHFIERIDGYTPHVRSHPPGMILILWGMSRIGLDGAWPAALLMIAGGAVAVPAVLVALRDVAGEARARVAAPFVALAPAAVWVATSGDAFFAGVAGWAVTLLVLATGRRDRRGDGLAVAGGALFGIALFLSYGFVVLGLIPLAVAAARRRVRPLVLAVPGVVAVAALFAAAGFWWTEGLGATHEQYLAGVSRLRPYWYFVVANPAALAIALGPVTAVALARLRDRRAWLLAGGALLAVVAANLSGLSKGEVERIWLPFVPWILVATCAFADAEHGTAGPARAWLGAHLVAGITVQVGVRSPW